MSEPIEGIPLLNRDECGNVHETVNELKDRWVRRWENLPFYTLGAASYLDGEQHGYERYHELAMDTNPMLSSSFGWLHDKVLDALSSYLGERVVMDRELAVPGFHIFHMHPQFGLQGGSPHFDHQYEHVDWSSYESVDLDQQISFTLPVRLPSGGGGLRVWPVDWIELKPLPSENRRSHALGAKCVDHEYEEGRLEIHSGHLLHCILPMRLPQGGDERVTMQGHALRTSRGWVAYW